MKYYDYGTLKGVSAYSLGCMRIASLSPNAADKLLSQATDCGINFFDHADIYGAGNSEKVFSKWLGQRSRDKIYLQSKCGIKNGEYDSSYQHIIQSVDGILTRLNTDYLDCLLLHRPDTLIEPEQVGAAFEKLFCEGKVRAFGVSNHNAGQIKLLKKYCTFPLLFNQLQFGLAFTGLIDEGLNVNMKNDSSVLHNGSLLDYMRLKDVALQAWSPLQYGFFEGVFIGSEKFPILNAELEQLGKRYGVSPSAIAISWINSHPAHFMTVLGTTNPIRLNDICAGSDITLTHKEWYGLYCAAGNVLP